VSEAVELLDDLVLEMKVRHEDFMLVAERIEALADAPPWGRRRLVHQLRDILLDLDTAIGKTRDTLKMHGFGDVGERRTSPHAQLESGEGLS
jgi:hypothetical protein